MLLRWLKRFVIGVLALVFVAAVFVVVAVHTDWGREQIRKRVEAALRDAFPGGARVGALEGSVFGDLVVRDIELATADGKPMVTVGKVELRLAWRALFGKTARIERLIAEDVVVAITGAPISNEPPKPDEETRDASPSSWSIELPDIAVKNVRVAVANGGRPIDLDGVQLTGSLLWRAGDPMELTAGHLTGTWRQRSAEFAGSLAVKLGDPIDIARVSLDVGGVRLEGRDLLVDTVRPRGTLEITGKGKDLARLAPEVDIPRGVQVKIVADGDRFHIAGLVGKAKIDGLVRGDLAKRTASVVVSLDDVDAAVLSRKRFQAKGSLFAVASLGPPARPGEDAQIRALIQARGAWHDTPGASATISVAGTRRHLDATLLATGDGGLSAAGRAALDLDGGRVRLASSQLDVSADDLPKITKQRVAVAGKVSARLEATGDLAPSPRLTVRGTAGGTKVRYDDISIASLDVTDLAAVVDPARFTDAVLASAHISVAGAAQGRVPLGSTVVDAYNCDGGRVLARYPRPTERAADGPGCTNKIFASITANPAAAKGMTLITDAVVVPGRTPAQPLVAADLGAHRLRLANGDVWTGRGGRVVVGRDQVVRVRGLAENSRGSSIGGDVDYTIPTSTLSVRAEARALPALAIDPAWKGTASGSLALVKRGSRIDGKGTFKLAGLEVGGGVPIIDGDATVAVAGSKVTVEATAVTPSYGGARVALEIAGPRDITDVDAWRALDRSAVHSAELTALRIDLAGAKVPTGGFVDGQVKIAGVDTTGTLSVSSVHTVLGDAKGEIAFHPAGSNVRAFTNADIEGLGTASITAELAFPERPFDPEAWNRLGRGVLDKLIASIDKVEITPARLAALGIEGVPYSGRADVALNLVSGATTAKIDFDLRNVRGGFLARPVDMHVHAETDADGSRARAEVLLPSAIKSSPIPDDKRTVLARLDLETPVVFQRWIDAPRSVASASLRGNFAIPELGAPVLLSVLGRKDAASGTLVGTGTIAGRLGAPIGRGEIIASKVQGAPSKSLRPIRLLKELKIVADWDGTTGTVAITGDEEGGGFLRVTASGRAELASIHGTAKIRDFDLAPFAAFLPGEYAAATGTVRADVTVRGLDTAGHISGELHLDKATVPLHTLLGTLQGCPHRGEDACADTDPLWEGARADVTLSPTGDFKFSAAGYLNRGKATLTATAPRDFSKITIKSLVLDRLSPIHELEPVLDGTIVGEIKRGDGGYWSGVAHVQKGARVTIPGRFGDTLLDEDAPDDLFFVDEGVPQANFRIPEDPWLHIDIDFSEVKVHVEEFEVNAKISTDWMRVEVGDTIGVTGKIGIERGSTADVFGKDYEIEARVDAVTFDGTLDPLLNIRMQHTFRGPDSFDMFVEFTDRVSVTKPRFTSTSRNYTDGQLFAFFVGGEPNSGEDATKNIGIGAGSSVLSSAVGRRLKKRLPYADQIDVLKCDFTTTATQGASCTVGKWFSPRAFVAVRPKLDWSRPNENKAEGIGQYFVFDHWLLEGIFGDYSKGIDILWNKRW
ncbi:MAG: translocation/assembly module TamB domain-containing protein [Deltaproteobacteria bacterium]|nr:translocation/assembly module TamB domain-containing protein [Deltaproteobacteria bacterium]